MTPGILSSLKIILSLLSWQVWCAPSPNNLIPVTNATCQPEYAWMNNAEQQSPCLTVAYVIAACAGDSWVQPALPSGSFYNPPNGATATPCYCSWSCYNLLMACTLCQSTTNDITSWSSFSQNCPSNYTDEMFPQGYTIDIPIPYWATINPVNWTSGVFNIGQAQIYVNQSNVNPDSGSSPSRAGSHTDVGTIIGGTVGGVACILLILIGGLFLCKHRQSRRLDNMNNFPPIQYTGTTPRIMHTRWESDTPTVFSQTMRSPSPSVPYMTTQLPGMNGTGTGIFQPPSGYMHALPASVSSHPLSPIRSTTSLPPTSLVPPVSSSFTSNGQSVVPLVVDAAEMISPFFATSSRYRSNRSDESGCSTRSKATEVHSGLVMAAPEQRGRLNPPPYSASAESVSPREVTFVGQRLPMTEPPRPKSSLSVSTMHFGHSRAPTAEGGQVDLQPEQSSLRAASPDIVPAYSVESSEYHPPAF